MRTIVEYNSYDKGVEIATLMNDLGEKKFKIEVKEDENANKKLVLSSLDITGENDAELEMNKDEIKEMLTLFAQFARLVN